jgi:hypothetical protein
MKKSFQTGDLPGPCPATLQYWEELMWTDSNTLSLMYTDDQNLTVTAVKLNMTTQFLKYMYLI